MQVVNTHAQAQHGTIYDIHTAKKPAVFKTVNRNACDSLLTGMLRKFGSDSMYPVLPRSGILTIMVYTVLRLKVESCNATFHKAYIVWPSKRTLRQLAGTKEPNQFDSNRRR